MVNTRAKWVISLCNIMLRNAIPAESVKFLYTAEKLFYNDRRGGNVRSIAPATSVT